MVPNKELIPGHYRICFGLIVLHHVLHAVSQKSNIQYAGLSKTTNTTT